ncbi:peptidoglycan editing factor PgeF [Marinomonas agarivorans]|nr:peptidoglycan editing factor PgeF [Marinomonas agarivorans]
MENSQYSDSIIIPDWPAPNNVRAFSSTRLGGKSTVPYDSLNLGGHVGDDPESVHSNRQRFMKQTSMPETLRWLQQVHGTSVVEWPSAQQGDIEADAAYSRVTHQVCAVMTADCLPILFCNAKGTEVAACHAGWRGLCAGVIEATLAKFSLLDDVLVWLGPAIGPQKFEVGAEVRSAFMTHDPQAKHAFVPLETADKWLANLYLLARQRLVKQGVKQIYGGDFCTYTDTQRFFSYRRDKDTGRMATSIWLVE